MKQCWPAVFPQGSVCGVAGACIQGLTYLQPGFSCHPSWHDKYVVSILVFTYIQCDGAWWFPLTGCHGYPVQSALLVLGSTFFRHHSPCSSIVDGFNSGALAREARLWSTMGKKMW